MTVHSNVGDEEACSGCGRIYPKMSLRWYNNGMALCQHCPEFYPVQPYPVQLQQQQHQQQFNNGQPGNYDRERYNNIRSNHRGGRGGRGGYQYDYNNNGRRPFRDRHQQFDNNYQQQRPPRAMNNNNYNNNNFNNNNSNKQFNRENDKAARSNDTEVHDWDSAQPKDQSKNETKTKYTQTTASSSISKADRLAWEDERKRLNKKIEDVVVMEKIADSLKEELKSKDIEINALKEKIRSLKPVPTVAIDIGTTNACIAVVDNGEVRTICNERNEQLIRSCVVFNDPNSPTDEDPVQVGVDAVSPNSVVCVKRLIGISYDAALEEEDTLFLPYELSGDRDGGILIGVPSRPHESITVVEAVALILEKLKQTAERHFNGRKVTNAVISLPAGFSDRQRLDVIDAANVAGLNVVRLVGETDALIECYKMRSWNEGTPRKLLVVSMGGGVTEVSCISLFADGQFQLFDSTTSWYGGEDIDHELMYRFESEIKAKFGKVSASALCQLKRQCQKAKEDLSSGVKQADISLEINGEPFRATLSKQEFSNILADTVVHRLYSILETMMAHRKGSPEEIILSGGCTRIPAVLELLQKRFKESALCKSVNCGQAVAQGAAILASKLDDGTQQQDELKPMLALNVAVRVFDAVTKKVIGFAECNSCQKLPKKLDIIVDWDEGINTAKFNEIFVTMSLDYMEIASSDLIPMKPGNIKFTVEFDSSGVIDCCYLIFSSYRHDVIPMEKFYSGLSKMETRRVASKLNKYREEALSRQRQKEMCNKLDRLITLAEGMVTDASVNKELKSKCTAWAKWFDANSNATVDELKKKYESIEAELKTTGVTLPAEAC